jgi:hypothetical protein
MMMCGCWHWLISGSGKRTMYDEITNECSTLNASKHFVTIHDIPDYKTLVLISTSSTSDKREQVKFDLRVRTPDVQVQQHVWLYAVFLLTGIKLSSVQDIHILLPLIIKNHVFLQQDMWLHDGQLYVDYNKGIFDVRSLIQSYMNKLLHPQTEMTTLVE